MELEEHRREVAKIDEKIIRLVSERMEVSKKIFQAKKSEGRSISDPNQEKVVLRRAIDLSIELGLDAGAIRAIFQILIRMSLQKQRELQGDEQG